MRMPRWWNLIWASVAPPRRVRVIESDSLPASIGGRNLILAREDGEDWCVGFRCPCGCSAVIELLLVAEAKPRWDVDLDARDIPTLHPSVWRKGGCGSHFILMVGRVRW